MPPLKSDAHADVWLAQDLSNLEFLQFKPVQFECEEKEEQLTPHDS